MDRKETEFRARFAKRYALPPQEAERLLEAMERLAYARKTVIRRAGAADRYVWLVESGIVLSTLTCEEKERVLDIAFDDEAPIPFAPLLQAVPSPVEVRALSDCTLWRMAKERLDALCRERTECARWVIRLAEESMEKERRYWIDYYGLDKAAQYRRLLASYPRMIRQLPMQVIASWLNITPQSLSRIRAQSDLLP